MIHAIVEVWGILSVAVCAQIPVGTGTFVVEEGHVPSEHLIEDVVRPLPWPRFRYATLLQEVARDT